MVFGLLKLAQPKKAAPAEPPSVEVAPSGKSGGSGAKSALTVNEFVARTKRCREKGLEPTKPELIAYARYLGIDPIVDGDLMWIADEALNAPLPSEWTEHHDSADRVFYYNVQTHASSWTHPLEQLHRDTYKCIVNFRSGDLSKEERGVELEKLRRKCEESEHEAHRELQAWSEHTDEQGQKFYYNREHQRSVWTDPRPARCHALYLQMKALRVLSKQLGQSAPIPRRGLEPLSGGAHQSSGLEAPLSHRTDDRDPGDAFPSKHGRGKKERPPQSGLDDNEGDMPFGGQLDVSSWGGNALEEDMRGSEEATGKKKRKKRNRDRDAEAASNNDVRDRDRGGLAPLAPVQMAQHGSSAKGLGGLPDPGSPGLSALSSPPLGGGLLDIKKPSISAVDEVRQAIGVSGGIGSRLPPMGGPLGHNNPFGNPGHARLESPQRDGLPQVGRAKVRAGIRLDPL